MLTKQREKRFLISYLALKLRYMNKTDTESGVEKSSFQVCLKFSPTSLENMKNYLSLSVSRAVYADVSLAVWHELYDHSNTLQIESDPFCASGLVVMRFFLWEEGSGKQDLRVVEV